MLQPLSFEGTAIRRSDEARYTLQAYGTGIQRIDLQVFDLSGQPILYQTSESSEVKNPAASCGALKGQRLITQTGVDLHAAA
jgi:hypothetical protein